MPDSSAGSSGKPGLELSPPSAGSAGQNAGEPVDDPGSVSAAAGGAADGDPSSAPGEGGATDMGDGGRPSQIVDDAGTGNEPGDSAGIGGSGQGGKGTAPGHSGRAGTGGASDTGGRGGSAAGGMPAAGGTPSSAGGAGGAGGVTATGVGGELTTGGAGGALGNGGTTGGTVGSLASGGAGGVACSFSVSPALSTSIATVGIVNWSSTLADVASARVVYTLDAATNGTLNPGGTAPADPTESNHRTLLLGLKQGKSYKLHVEVDGRSGTHCASDDFELTTGTLPGAPAITRNVVDASAQAPGFVIVGNGFGSSAPVVIIDADGDVVWSAPAPASTSRARMDYEGKNMWMIAANATNNGGDLRFVSMDGLTSGSNLSGLSNVHHDFTALPGGAIAVLSWAGSGLDQESDLLERLPDGTVETLFHVGSNLYAGGQSSLGGGAHSYHANSVAYHASDDSFTIGDRNPSSFVKVGHDGTLRWQFGGTCAGAKAPMCVAGTWQVNHGHQLLDDGTFLFFNNTGMGKTTPSNALTFMLHASTSFSASELEHWSGGDGEHSDTLGDVQRLPNGNTLVTFSNDGVIYEVDATWKIVQTLSASSFGYSEWRPTLYGAPTR